MALHFCKSCGALYNDKDGPCPKCATKELMEAVAANTYAPEAAPMDEEAARAARRRAWIQILIGMPCFIGFIYLIGWLFIKIQGG